MKARIILENTDPATIWLDGMNVPETVDEGYITAAPALGSGTEEIFSEWGSDEKTLLLLFNHNSEINTTVTVHGGDGIQGGGDLVFAIPALNFSAVMLESGRFKITAGENKGKIRISCSDPENSMINAIIVRLP